MCGCLCVHICGGQRETLGDIPWESLLYYFFNQGLLMGFRTSQLSYSDWSVSHRDSPVYSSSVLGL